MTPTPGVTTAAADTLTVQQLDHLTELLAAATVGTLDRAGYKILSGTRLIAETGLAKEADLFVAAVNALPALLAAVRRQQAALDAVTELADEWESQAERAKQATGVAPGRTLGAMWDAQQKQWELTGYATALRTALASPAPTEATT